MLVQRKAQDALKGNLQEDDNMAKKNNNSNSEAETKQYIIELLGKIDSLNDENIELRSDIHELKETILALTNMMTRMDKLHNITGRIHQQYSNAVADIYRYSDD